MSGSDGVRGHSARSRAAPRPLKPLESLRHLCLALPETTERLSHGEPTWFVRGQNEAAPHIDTRGAAALTSPALSILSIMSSAG